VRFRARAYNPSNGRFLTQDTYPYNFQNPVEINRYVYGINNPVRYMDASGMTALVSRATLTTIAINAIGLMRHTGSQIATGIEELLWGLTRFITPDHLRLFRDMLRNLPDIRRIADLADYRTSGLTKPYTEETEPYFTSEENDGTDDAEELDLYTPKPNRNKDWDYVADELGMDRKELSDNLHKIKDSAGVKGNKSVSVDLNSGDVYFNGENIGNLFDGW
jgi:hypothetical protein